MRTLQRNLVPVYIAEYTGKTESTDTDGNYTGETTEKYSAPVKIMANPLKVTGRAIAEQYGLNVDYDRVVVFDNFELAKILNIAESDLVWIEKTPATNSEGEPIVSSPPDNDYIIKAISESFNGILLVCKKVM